MKKRSCVLETQTRGSMMAGADESTELWQHPNDKGVTLWFIMCNFSRHQLLVGDKLKPF